MTCRKPVAHANILYCSDKCEKEAKVEKDDEITEALAISVAEPGEVIEPEPAIGYNAGKAPYYPLKLDGTPAYYTTTTSYPLVKTETKTETTKQYTEEELERMRQIEFMYGCD
jgi:hypothetical protein